MGDDGGDTEPVLHLHHIETLPEDAVRMGLDRNTQEGAMLGMAGSLSAAKLSHRVIAWTIILGLTLPLVMTVLSQLF